MSMEHSTAEKDADVRTHTTEPASPEVAPSQDSTPVTVNRSPRSSTASQAAGFFAQRSAQGQATLMRHIQRTHGNRYAQRVVAQLRATVQRECQCGGSCDSCKAASASGGSPTTPPLIQTRVRVQTQSADGGGGNQEASVLDLQPSGSSGQPMDGRTRQSMESHFNRGFGMSACIPIQPRRRLPNPFRQTRTPWAAMCTSAKGNIIPNRPKDVS